MALEICFKIQYLRKKGWPHAIPQIPKDHLTGYRQIRSPTAVKRDFFKGEAFIQFAARKNPTNLTFNMMPRFYKSLNKFVSLYCGRFLCVFVNIECDLMWNMGRNFGWMTGSLNKT